MDSVTLARALADGGRVIWDDPPERPRLRVAPAWAALLRTDPAALRDVLTRAAQFRREVEAARDRPGLPLLTLLHAPAPRAGCCISCGDRLVEGWRCMPCLVGVYIALEVVPPRDVLDGPRAEPHELEDLGP